MVKKFRVDNGSIHFFQRLFFFSSGANLQSCRSHAQFDFSNFPPLFAMRKIHFSFTQIVTFSSDLARPAMMIFPKDEFSFNFPLGEGKIARKRRKTLEHFLSLNSDSSSLAIFSSFFSGLENFLDIFLAFSSILCCFTNFFRSYKY